MPSDIKSSCSQGSNESISLPGLSRDKSGGLTRVFPDYKSRAKAGGLLAADMRLSGLGGSKALGLLAVLPGAERDERKMPVFRLEE